MLSLYVYRLCVGITAVLTLSAHGRLPLAYAEDTCDQYARTAVEHQAINVQRHCGLTGWRWQANYTHHATWCQNSSRHAAAYETQARAQVLAHCQVGSEEQCTPYARTAVEQHRANIRHTCGLSGLHWHGNYDEHYAWCRRVLPSAAVLEARARGKGLLACW